MIAGAGARHRRQLRARPAGDRRTLRRGVVEERHRHHRRACELRGIAGTGRLQAAHAVRSLRPVARVARGLGEVGGGRCGTRLQRAGAAEGMDRRHQELLHRAGRGRTRSPGIGTRELGFHARVARRHPGSRIVAQRDRRRAERFHRRVDVARRAQRVAERGEQRRRARRRRETGAAMRDRGPHVAGREAQPCQRIARSRIARGDADGFGVQALRVRGIAGAQRRLRARDAVGEFAHGRSLRALRCGADRAAVRRARRDGLPREPRLQLHPAVGRAPGSGRSRASPRACRQPAVRRSSRRSCT